MSRIKLESAETGEVKDSLAALAQAARGESVSSPVSGWTLPSGEELLDYALKGGFLAPALMKSDSGQGSDSAVELVRGKR